MDQGAPSEQTQVYIAYDERNFYLAARMEDHEAQQIVARQLIQGGNLNSDDSFEVVLDTFNTKRTGYHFRVNANGIRRDGLFENANEINQDWSGIWQVESTIDAQGYTITLTLETF